MDYLQIFIAGSAFGSANEYRLFEKKPESIRGIVANVYGFGAMIVYFVHKMNWSIGISLLLIVIALLILECVSGKIAYLINGKKMWDYTSSTCICEGYIHPLATLYFTGMSLVFLMALKVYDKTKKPLLVVL